MKFTSSYRPKQAGQAGVTLGMLLSRLSRRAGLLMCLSTLLYQLTPSAKATPTHIHRHRFFLDHALSSAVIFIATVGLVVLFAICANVGFGISVVASTSLHSQALSQKSCGHEEILRRVLRTRMSVHLCHSLDTPSTCDGKDGSASKSRCRLLKDIVWPKCIPLRLCRLETARPWPPYSAPLHVP